MNIVIIDIKYHLLFYFEGQWFFHRFFFLLPFFSFFFFFLFSFRFVFLNFLLDSITYNFLFFQDIIYCHLLLSLFFFYLRL
ncbi:MAG: hypothetical protein EU542_06035 [Promethearchaeota archaeon]|nr:MAG: hypothetical protein EU542_06035 [Candidatus Lokiarchaeota archaeon]